MISISRTITLSLILINVALVSSAQLLLKIGTTKIQALSQELSEGKLVTFILKIGTNPYIFSGTMCYVLSLALWLYILTRSQLSVAYPLMSLSYVVVMILSLLIIKENINFMQWPGAILIILGTSLIFLFK